MRPLKARPVADGRSVDLPKSKDKVAHPPRSEDSDDQSPDDLSFNGYEIRKRVKGEDRKPSQASKWLDRRRLSKSSTNLVRYTDAR